MMFKTRSYRLVDALVNHPDIRPTFEPGDHYLYSADVIGDSRNVVYAGEEGVVMFIYEKPGVYKGHVGLLKAARGARGLAACRECLDDLFTRFDASVVRAAVPLQLRAARRLCRLLGFRSTGTDNLQEFFAY